MKRRALALFLVTCLLAGFAPSSGAAALTLVCRMTGQPMAPVIVATTTPTAPEADHSCCAVAAAATRADGGTRYVLVAPGCCDLRAAPERAERPAAVIAAAPEVALLAWVPAPPVLLVPPATEAVTLPTARSEAAPRAPPRSSASPRAPPFFS
jgi:hypothetical protein